MHTVLVAITSRRKKLQNHTIIAADLPLSALPSRFAGPALSIPKL